jgi:hypothetical protein
MGGALPETEYLDVETETWDVLPPGERPAGPTALAEAIAAELAYTRNELEGLGLSPPAEARSV